MDISVVSGADILPYLPFLGLALIIGEFLLPTKGFMGVTGAILFVVGTIILTTHSDSNIRISIMACIVLNVVVLGSSAILAYFTYRGYNAYSKDSFDLVGKTAHVVDWNTKHQRIDLDGAIWIAKTADATSLSKGQAVRVVSQNNLTLTVEPAGNQS